MRAESLSIIGETLETLEGLERDPGTGQHYAVYDAFTRHPAPSGTGKLQISALDDACLGWGLSPSAAPDGSRYAEYGYAELGLYGYPAGAVAPYAAAGVHYLDPAAATKDLRDLVRLYPSLLTTAGFHASVDPRTRMTSREMLSWDQMLLLLGLVHSETRSLSSGKGAVVELLERGSIATRAREALEQLPLQLLK